MKNKFLLKLMVLPLLLISFLGQVTIVAAETIQVTIEGNGAGSDNQAQVEVKSETKVEQNNEANIENNVDANANTGNNTANNNSGDTAIVTGDASVNTSVENNYINTNYAQQCNCPTNTTTNVSISGNGSGSTNTTNLNQSNNTYVAQNNNANITNNVTVNANTGYNTANNNGGDVTIKTGKISATTIVENSNINNNNIKGFGSKSSSLMLKIFGNGANSENFINISSDNSYVYVSDNSMHILNNIFHNLNTGKNKANGNLGDVAILTGDIKSVIEVLNQGNSNSIALKCDKKDKPEKPDKPGEEQPPVTPKPGNGNVSNGNGGNGNGHGGETLGVTNGEVLPVTGNLGLFLMTLFLGILLISGWYLRNTSGVSPPNRV